MVQWSSITFSSKICCPLGPLTVALSPSPGASRKAVLNNFSRKLYDARGEPCAFEREPAGLRPPCVQLADKLRAVPRGQRGVPPDELLLVRLREEAANRFAVCPAERGEVRLDLSARLRGCPAPSYPRGSLPLVLRLVRGGRGADQRRATDDADPDYSQGHHAGDQPVAACLALLLGGRTVLSPLDSVPVTLARALGVLIPAGGCCGGS